jgi:hypothetical protein
LVEIALVEIIFFLSLWLLDEYIASLVTSIMVPIFGAILVISLIAELIERSKVPKVYFYFLIISVIIPTIIGLFFLIIYQGNLDWLDL